MAGAFPRTNSLDCAGPIARSVGDAAALLAAMTGDDASNGQRVGWARGGSWRSCPEDLRGLRLATIEDYTYRDVDPQVGDAVWTAMGEFARLGADIRNVQIPCLAAGSLNHSYLFDILLYEFHKIMGDRYRQIAHGEEFFGPIVRANLERGAQISDEMYQRALHNRPKCLSEFKRAFAEVDAVVTPTVPIVAPLLTEAAVVFDRGRQFNISISYLGLPSISVPCGFDSAGMPIGLLVTGDAFAESLILRVAASFERAACFERSTPVIRRPL